MSMEVDAEPPLNAAPKPILRLDEKTINRIAAGEVIQRPANAVKELLENALDAGSTRIVVTVKEGGAKLITIQDNGCGIRKEDLHLLCERFTTSKITAYSDLSSLTSYGFRGEALASMSYSSHLSVTTKTKSGTCGYKAAYADGVLVPLKAGQDAEPKLLAATDGTLIVIEDLFHNNVIRRKALGAANVEYNRIFEVVSRYAIHNSGIAMVCRKAAGNATPDLSTSNDATVLDNIGIIHGEAIRRELLEFKCEDAEIGFKVEGYISNANYSAKKATLLLFINNRLVSCDPLRKAIENQYATVLPKGGHSFAYLSLHIQPDKLDVNMHPTKAEVRFLDQDEIIEAIAVQLQETLANANTSRTFKVQTVLPGVSASQAPVASSSKLAPQKLVRTDGKAQTLEGMLGYDATQGGPSKFRNGQAIDLTVESDASDEEVQQTQRSKIPVSECKLTSVNSLRRKVTASKQASALRYVSVSVNNDKRTAVHDILRNHTFVGFVGLDQPRVVLQYSTKMYLASYLPVCDALFYQLGLRQFGRLPRTKLKPPPSLRDLVELALTRQTDLPDHLTPEEIADKVCERFVGARAMLEEYFSLVIDDEGLVIAIPLLLPRYAPNLEKLPQFLLRAGVQVNWKDERECFTTFLRELAVFHRPGPFVAPDCDAGCAVETTPQDQHIVQHVVFPAIKLYLEADSLLLEHLTELTSMESLYRRFGRC